MRHVILFTGTRLMDGAYSEFAQAQECAEHLREQFPRLQVDLIEVREGFIISDDMFWANHMEELEDLNSARDGRDKRTLTDVPVQSHHH